MRGRRVLAVMCALFVVLALAAGGLLVRHGRQKAEASGAQKPGAPPVFVQEPEGIVLHHSDTPAKIAGRVVDAAFLDEEQARDHPGWVTVFEGKAYHIAYHYVILPDGTVQQGRPDHCIGAHARTHNTWLGICLVGAFSNLSNPQWHPSRPTRAQMASLLALCHRLMSQYHIPPENVKQHRDVSLTWCPGGRFPYNAVIRDLRGYAATHPDVYAGAARVALSSGTSR